MTKIIILNDCWKQTDTWCQTRASRGMTGSICYAVRSVSKGTLSEPSTHDALALGKTIRFQSISNFRIQIRDNELYCYLYTNVFQPRRESLVLTQPHNYPPTLTWYVKTKITTLNKYETKWISNTAQVVKTHLYKKSNSYKCRCLLLW
jgi:hypothetical protein